MKNIGFVHNVEQRIRVISRKFIIRMINLLSRSMYFKCV